MFACKSFNNRARTLYNLHPLITNRSKKSVIRIHEAFYAVSAHKRAPFESKATRLFSAITQRRFVLLFVMFRSRKEISSLHDQEMKHEIIV
jgi:hypothetical protein